MTRLGRFPPRRPKKSRHIRLMSLRYDAASAARKTHDRGLPAGYADAVKTGPWPSCDVLRAAELAGKRAAVAKAAVMNKLAPGRWPERAWQQMGG